MGSLLGPKSVRALTFVNTLTERGVQPSKSEVHAFVEARTTSYDYNPMTEELYVPTVDYLLNARLLTYQSRRLVLTEIGHAILAAELRQPSAPMEVVGRMSDPFVYAELLTQINLVPDALVVDPYLHPDDLAALVRLPNVRRVLTRDIRMPNLQKTERRQQLGIRIGAGSHAELRFFVGDKNELHDRLILPASAGQALHLGTSLGGTQVTVLTRLSSGAASALRTHYERLWAAGERVTPIRREPAETTPES